MASKGPGRLKRTISCRVSSHRPLSTRPSQLFDGSSQYADVSGPSQDGEADNIAAGGAGDHGESPPLGWPLSQRPPPHPSLPLKTNAAELWRDDEHVHSVLQAHARGIHRSEVRRCSQGGFFGPAPLPRSRRPPCTLRHPSKWILKFSEIPRDIWSTPAVYTNDLPLGNGVLRPPAVAPVPPPAAPATALPPAKRARVEPCEAVPSAEEGAADSGRWWASETAWAGAPAPQDDAALPRCEVVLHPILRAQQRFPNMQPFHHLSTAEVTDPEAAATAGPAMLVSSSVPFSLTVCVHSPWFHATRSMSSFFLSFLLSSSLVPQHFDVFPANSQFSRKVPGTPIFIICVCEGDAPPALEALNAADATAVPVPVRYVRVEAGDVSFFALARTELKNILR